MKVPCGNLLHAAPLDYMLLYYKPCLYVMMLQEIRRTSSDYLPW